MPRERTHASFFSGAGGLDLGLERGGWRTVSTSEIDPYASALLAQRWPEAPNLGCIHTVAGAAPHGHRGYACTDPLPASQWPPEPATEWQRATLWSGGFPCQDLSVAGKRAGLAGSRSGLAFAFLGLVEQHRPPAILLENVPGLLTSHRGRDLFALVRRLEELGYGPTTHGSWAYRVLDARYFGVPQRRQRVFLLALHAALSPAAERAAEVLSVGTRCDRHPPPGGTPWEETTDRPVTGFDIAGSLTRRYGKGVNSTVDDGALVIAGAVQASSGHHGHSSPRGDGSDNLIVGALTGRPYDDRGHENGALVATAGRTPADADRDGAADGLAGRLDDRGGLAAEEGHVTALTAGLGSGGPDAAHAQAGWLVPAVYVKRRRAASELDHETWDTGEVAPTVNAFDVGDQRATTLVPAAEASEDDRLLPPRLDSHRYRCCGNGVVAPVAGFLGAMIAEGICS